MAGCSRRPAIAVSGGADSLALAWLARDWGTPLALIVDHGLRAASCTEAAETARRLAGFGLPCRILTLQGLIPGAALAERARDARYRALIQACREEGRVDLLTGHHQRDQAETVLMRQGAGSGAAGLAGMPVISETGSVRLLRPLLGVPPSPLRDILRAEGICWVEDPSNANPATMRARLRAELREGGGEEPRIAALSIEATSRAAERRRQEACAAAELASRVAIYPEGYAVLSAGPIGAASLSALIRGLSGSRYLPASASVAALASDPRPAVLGGIRLLPAGRMGAAGDLLLVREEAAIGPPVPASDGEVWDGRFRLQGALAGAVVGALGAEAARLRRHSPLPAAILRTMPGLFVNGTLADLPAFGYQSASGSARDLFHWGKRGAERVAANFVPATPVSGALFGVP